MATTIDQEAKKLSILLTDIDRQKLKYQTREVDSETDTHIKIQFVSPTIFLYEDFRFYLLKNSQTKDVSPKNFFRPDYVSYEEYGTTILWTLLLFINDIPSIEEFNQSPIYIPSISSIFRVAKQYLPQAPINVDEINRLSNKTTAKIYSRTSQPVAVSQDITAQPVQKQLYFIRQTFDIDIPIASRQYVDLTYAPLEQSIVFKIKDKAAFMYGRDYILIRGNSSAYDRISWKKQDVTEDGLSEVIESGMTLEIQYAKELTGA